jgi:hypothetical protein
MAPELDMELVVEKGWVVGEEWERNGFFKFRDNVKPFPCLFLAAQLGVGALQLDGLVVCQLLQLGTEIRDAVGVVAL